MKIIIAITIATFVAELARYIYDKNHRYKILCTILAGPGAWIFRGITVLCDEIIDKKIMDSRYKTILKAKNGEYIAIPPSIMGQWTWATKEIDKYNRDIEITPDYEIPRFYEFFHSEIMDGVDFSSTNNLRYCKKNVWSRVRLATAEECAFIKRCIKMQNDSLW